MPRKNRQRRQNAKEEQATVSALQPEAAASERQAESGQCDHDDYDDSVDDDDYEDDDRAPRQNAKGEEAAVSGSQPEASADFGDDTDSEEESVWTDEEEHKAWRRMTIEERLKNVKNMKRKFIWFSQQQEADNESALQPEARNDKLPHDILQYLQKHQLRHISHPCKNE